MPAKRRAAKRRRDPQADYSTWESIFDYGCDFFGELAGAGVASDAYGHPDERAAREAWQRYGRRYLEERGGTTATGTPLWALQQFGEPDRAS